MKKLLIVVSFVAVPLFSGAALAGGCEHGHYAEQRADSEDPLIAKETDPDLLELLRKQREQDAPEAEAVITYN